MIMLDLFDSLKDFKTFDIKKYKLNKIRKFLLSRQTDYMYMEQIQNLAKEKKRYDILKEVKRSAIYSKRISKPLKFIKWLNKQRFFWRFSEPLKKLILSGAII